MRTRIQKGQLAVDSQLCELIEKEIMPGTGVVAENFWAGFDAIVHDLAPKNKACLLYTSPSPRDS